MLYDGMNVSIRDVQKIQIEILLEFDRICKKHNIKYQLFAGTLLGAIRHKGFIPWDDDIDVCLLRQDYNKFLEVCNTELDGKYFLQNYKTDRNSRLQFSKIRKNNTIFKMDMYKDINIHHGVFIDVFPLDNFEMETFLGRLHQKLVNILYSISWLRSRNSCYNAKSPIRKYIKLCIFYLLKLVPRYIYDRLLEKVISALNKKETKYVTHFTNGASLQRCYKYMMNKCDFYDIISGEFEGHLFPIPKNYDSVLRRLFGDYMEFPPKEQQKPHHNVIEIKLDA